MSELQDALISSLSLGSFLSSVKLQEPGRGAVQMEEWPHLLEAADTLDSGSRLIWWAKARQIGASWLVAAWVAYTVIHTQNSNIALISQGQAEAQELLSKVRFILQNLPVRLQVPLGKDNTQDITVPACAGRIRAYPSTPDAGRGETFSLVVFDEADHHQFFKENYATVKPTLDDVGGQLIAISTIDPKTTTSAFKELGRGAPGNGFKVLFYGWGVRPNRDADWYQSRRSEAQDIFLFEKENPATLEEALAPAASMMAFDKEALEGMAVDVRAPIAKLGPGLIWQKHQVGKRYGVGTDTAHGVGGDEAVTIVMDMDTGMIVARIKSDMLDPETLAYDSMNLLSHYKDPLWAIEDNEWGILTIKAAQRLGYPNLYYRDAPKPQLHGKGPPREGRVGWHTDELTRYVLWGDLMDAVQSRLLIIPDESGLAQFWDVIRNPRHSGRIEAIDGGHDDYPTAVGIAWQMRKHARAIGKQEVEAKRYVKRRRW